MTNSGKKKKEFKEIAVGVHGAAAGTEYVRGRFHHYLRWIMFLIILLIVLMLALTSYRSHALLHRGFLLQEAVGYTVCALMLLPTLPSVLLEVDYVKIEKDAVIFHNLFMRRKELWEDIIKIYDHRYLKFVLIRSKKFWYLINRRDFAEFGTLFETIKENAKKLKN